MSYAFLHIAIAALMMLAGASVTFLFAGIEPEGLGLIRGIALSGLALYVVIETCTLLRRVGRAPGGGASAPELRASSVRLLGAGALSLLLALSYLATIPPDYGALGPYRDIALLVLAAYLLIEAAMAHRRLSAASPEAERGAARERGRPAAGPESPGAHGLRIAALAVAGLVLVVLYSAAMPPGVLPPAWAAYRDILLAAVLVLILIDALVAVRRVATAPSLPASPAVQAARPPRVEEGADYGEALAFLAILQDKGRFIDFVMEDIAPYNDAQVAAASRVVHEGCAAVIREHLEISPLHAGKEGEAITVDSAVDLNRYRLVGKVVGSPPFRGVVVHRGWKTAKLALPRYSRPIDRSAQNVITPVEVEVR